MTRYVMYRLALFVPLLIGTTVVVFAYIHLIPGNPVEAMLGVYSNPEVVADIQSRYGLDAPVMQQYLSWVGSALTGDLGQTIRSSTDVTSLIASRAPATLLLAAGGLVTGLGIAVPLGTFAGIRRGARSDSAVNVLSLFGLAVPVFISGYLMLLVFAVRLGWFPTSGYVPLTDGVVDSLRHLALPALTLGVAISPYFIRVIRTEVAQVMLEPHLPFGRSKGLRPSWLLWRYVTRTTMPRIVVLVGVLVGGLLGGSVFVEAVFTWPGMGRLLVDAVTQREYFLIQGLVLVYAVVFGVVNLAAEVLQSALDPRVREVAQ